MRDLIYEFTVKNQVDSMKTLTMNAFYNEKKFFTLYIDT